MSETRKARLRFPNESVWQAWLGRCYEQLGDYERAAELIRKAQAMDNSPLLVGLLGHLYAVMGKPEDARREIQRLDEISRFRYVAAPFRAFIHAGLGEIDQAFRWLEQAYKDRSETLVFSQSWPLKYDPIWEPLRSDPRYAELLKKVGLDTSPK